MDFFKRYADRYLIVIVILLLTFSHAQATDVGISVRIGQPGFYGEIHLGDFYPVPDLIYPDPVIIQRPSVYVRQQPIYLHVPPGHAKLWHRYCYQYNACSQPVYFIRENWYNNVYVPHYHQHGSQQHRRIESLQYRHYDSDRHYQDRHYDTHRYDDDHDYREKRRYKSNDHRYGNDKHERYNRHDKHGKHDKNDRGRGKKHD